MNETLTQVPLFPWEMNNNKNRKYDPNDIFGSGIIREKSNEKIERAKLLGLYIDLFNQQEKRGVCVSSDDFDCEACAVLGQRGQGKSNTVTRIVEQLHPKHIGMTIFDIEGEYFSLKSKFNVLVVGAGASKHYDLQLSQVSPEVLAETAIKDDITVVLDFSDYDDEERLTFTYNYINAVSQVCTILKNENRPTQHILVVEEVQEYAPEEGAFHWGDNANQTAAALKKSIRRIAQRGRKRGIGLIIASQRSANVDKTLLSQCEHKILHKVTLPNDVSVYERLMGSSDTKTMRERLLQMNPGDAFVYFNDEWVPMHVQPQDTPHLGYSPKVSYLVSDIPDLKTIDKDILDKITAGSTSVSKKIRSPYQKQIDDLTKRAITAENTAANLAKNNESLSYQLSAIKNLKVQAVVNMDDKKIVRLLARILRDTPIAPVAAVVPTTPTKRKYTRKKSINIGDTNV